MREPIIFIVEDEELSNKFTTRYLKTKGYTQCYSYFSGEECLTNMHLKPDIIFLDHQMGNVSGLDVLKHIHSTSPDTKVVMLTSNGKTDLVSDALGSGVFDLVIKGDDELLFISNALNNIHQVTPGLSKPANFSLL